MGFFSRTDTPAPRLTIDGRPQHEPEQPGAMPRRGRLFYECLRRIAADPRATPAAKGTPVADGLGLEQLVSRIAPLFAHEPSLVPWVALRGALTELYIRTVDQESRRVPFYPTVEVVMGVGHVGNPPDDPTVDVGPEWQEHLSPAQREAAVGIYGAVARRAYDYARYSTMTIDDVRGDRCWPGRAVSLDIIAWSAVALLRLQLVDLSGVPAPDRLDRPGWYCEPLWGKAERYWDGGDWTARCRVRDGRGFVERSQPLG